GALATAFCVLTPEESLRLAASMPEVECLLITKNGERVESKGWRALEAPPAPHAGLVATPAAAEPQAWDQSFELIINLELARIEGHGYRRPYVAVWVEDKDRIPAHARAVVSEAALAARIESLVTRPPPARDGRNHGPDRLRFERHTSGGQIHAQVGRQGQPGQAGQTR